MLWFSPYFENFTSRVPSRFHFLHLTTPLNGDLHRYNFQKIPILNCADVLNLSLTYVNAEKQQPILIIRWKSLENSLLKIPSRTWIKLYKATKCKLNLYSPGCSKYTHYGPKLRPAASDLCYILAILAHHNGHPLNWSTSANQLGSTFQKLIRYCGLGLFATRRALSRRHVVVLVSVTSVKNNILGVGYIIRINLNGACRLF